MEKIWVFLLLGVIFFFLPLSPFTLFILLVSILNVTFFLLPEMDETPLNLLPFVVFLIVFFIYYRLYPVGWAVLTISFLILDLIAVGVLWNTNLEGSDILYLGGILLLPFFILILIENVVFAVITAFSILLLSIFTIFFLFNRNISKERVKEAGLKGETGKVLETIKGRKKKGKIKIRGEIWWAEGILDTSLSPGEEVIVRDIKDFTVFVEPLIECPNCGRSYAFSNTPQTCDCGRRLKAAKEKKE